MKIMVSTVVKLSCNFMSNASCEVEVWSTSLFVQSRKHVSCGHLNKGTRTKAGVGGGYIWTPGCPQTGVEWCVRQLNSRSHVSK